MNKIARYFLPILAASALSACAISNESATRAQTDTLSFSALAPETVLVHQQAESLTRLSKEMIRKSTGKGAAIGAAVGCGLVLVSAKNAQKCLGGAVVGGAVGAVVGHEQGKRKVAKSVAKVSANDMFNTLKETETKVSEVRTSLPETLAKQDAILASLQAQRDAGKLSPKAYKEQVMQIHEARARLAEALDNSAKSARTSADNLGVASLRQPELLWHIGAAKRLEQTAVSTHKQIKLF